MVLCGTNTTSAYDWPHWLNGSPPTTVPTSSSTKWLTGELFDVPGASVTGIVHRAPDPATLLENVTWVSSWLIGGHGIWRPSSGEGG